MLQPGVGHRIAPDEDGGGRTDVRRRVIRGYDEGGVSWNEEKLRRNGNVNTHNQVNDHVSLIKTVKTSKNKLELTGLVTAPNRKACFNMAFRRFKEKESETQKIKNCPYWTAAIEGKININVKNTGDDDDEEGWATDWNSTSDKFQF